MRTLFTLIGLVVVLAVGGLLARQQLTTPGASKAMLSPAPGVAPGHNTGAALPPAQQVQQYQQAIDALVQQRRVLPDDEK